MPVSLFQNLDLGKASTDEIWHLKSLRIESINIKVCPVTFFRNTVSEQNRISKSFCVTGLEQKHKRVKSHSIRLSSLDTASSKAYVI